MSRLLAPWQIEPGEFSAASTSAQKLKFLINYAILAPSGHNTQPWQFKIIDDEIELFCDRSRALPIVDPNHRELIISCGAALFNLKLAIRYFGYQDLVEIFPDDKNPNLLARISLGDNYEITNEERVLFQAISLRHTNRFPFSSQKIPDTLITKLHQIACSENIWIDCLDKQQCQEVIELIKQGDILQFANPQFRHELADWIRSGNHPRQDGIPGYAQGINRKLDFITPLIAALIRRFNLGKFQANKDTKLLENAQLLAILVTTKDTPEAWLNTGQVLSKILLVARTNNLWASFFNQPIEIPQLRIQLGNILTTTGYPQVLLRFGYGATPTATPRRSVAEVLANK